MAIWIVFELIKNRFPFFCWDSTVVGEATELLRSLSEPVKSFRPLAEQNCLNSELVKLGPLTETIWPGKP